MRNSLYLGSLSGAVAWVIYGIVECLFSSILPWLIKPSYDYIPPHWGFTALLFALYPAIGWILGASAGLCFRFAAERISFLQRLKPEVCLSSFATLTVVSAYAINLIVQQLELGSLGLSELAPLSISVVLIIALVFSALSDTWFYRFRFLTNPWTASIVLVGLPWINFELLIDNSIVIKAGVTMIYTVLVCLTSFLLTRTIQTGRLKSLIGPATSSQTRYIFLILLLLVLVLGTSFFLKQEPIVVASDVRSPSPIVNKPNIILIVMDTVRADHLSLYGYEKHTTPHLERLSEKATLYTNTIAPGDHTLPSHASIFTGMYASKHRAHLNPPIHLAGRPLAENSDTLAEILSEKGYLTAGIIANYLYVSHRFGQDQGFHYFDQRTFEPILGSLPQFYIRNSVCDLASYFAVPRHFDAKFRNAQDINSEAFRFLHKMQKEKRPLFLFINYMDAHWPYLPPKPFDKLFSGKDEDFTSVKYQRMWGEVMSLKRTVTNDEYNHLLSQYDGAIAYIDFHIEKLITKLYELGMYEDCLLIITADHGEAFGERNFIGHTVSVYQDQVHVPLIIKYPNIDKSVVVNETVSLVDIMPTILNLLGHEIPEDIQGQSLLKLESRNYRAVMSESFTGMGPRGLHPRFHRLEKAIFWGPFKLISSTSGKRELYDLSNDANEKKNLYRPDDGLSNELEAKLNPWFEDIKDEPASRVDLDGETIDRLRSLGYLK
jgi:arylsulfatase A-like enzyme